MEDIKIKDSLKPYKNIYDNIINRQTAKKNDVLMFFDYPCDEEVLSQIKQQVSPSAYHYMSYQNYNIDEEAILKTFSGMIKYTCNNLNGQFNLNRAAAAIGVTNEIIEIILEIFAESGMIKILIRENDYYQIEFLNSIELSKTLHSTKYPEFIELMNSINDYKNKFMTIEI